MPDPEFFYCSSKHEEAIARLLYAVRESQGAAMLTGDVGSGKTTVSRVFLQQLSNDRYEVVLIVNPRLSPDDFLKEILCQLNESPSTNAKSELLRTLHQRMMKNIENRKSTVIIIDEAQLVTDNMTLEELRLLLNFQLTDKFLLTLILIGQVELKNNINRIKQLEQRISIKYHLEPLNIEETAGYILFRLEKAGNKKNMFTREALNKIYQYSQGIPRKINNMCNLALLIGFSSKTKTVDSNIIDEVIKEL